MMLSIGSDKGHCTFNFLSPWFTSSSREMTISYGLYILRFKWSLAYNMCLKKHSSNECAWLFSL